MTKFLVKCTTVSTIAKFKTKTKTKKRFLIACFTSFGINPWGLPYVWLIRIFSPQPSLHPLWKVATLRRITFAGWFRVPVTGSGNVVVLWPQGLRQTSPTWGNAKVTICTCSPRVVTVSICISTYCVCSYLKTFKYSFSELRVLDKVPVGVMKLLDILKRLKLIKGVEH